MASPDPEGALQHESAAEPGARAGQPRGGDDRRIGNVPGDLRDEPARRAERGTDPRGIGREAPVEDRGRGEDRAPDGRADPLAREVAREAGRVADEREAGPGETAWTAAADRVRMAAERGEREVGGQPAARAEPCEEPLEAAADGQAAERADADVQEVALREVPAVALEVRLGD